MDDAREFDIVLWGATGFTGRLVAGRLFARHGPAGAHGGGGEGPVRWALAGRSEQRLAEVAEGLGDGAEHVGRIVADSHDRASLDAMARRARVVLTTVGPYSRHGDELVAACIAAGTDYCDLTGEVPWMRRMLDRHGEAAAKGRARIVHCCGFDSIPSDLGTWFLQREAVERFGAPAKTVRYRVRSMKGGISGGTVASMMEIAEAARGDEDMARVLKNPYALCPPGQRRGVRQPYVSGPGYEKDLDTAVAPFIMAAINTRIVHRSHALMGYPWGEDFTYDEALMTGPGFAGRARATAISVGLGAFALGIGMKPTRALMEKTFLPSPGEGPDEETRRKGRWHVVLRGEAADGQAIEAHVRGKGDPGYGSTCRMVSEAALCLARNPLPEGATGGFLTPATAMAEPLFQALQAHAGVSFTVRDR